LDPPIQTQAAWIAEPPPLTALARRILPDRSRIAVDIVDSPIRDARGDARMGVPRRVAASIRTLDAEALSSRAFPVNSEE